MKNNINSISDDIKQLLLTGDEKNIQLAFQLSIGLRGNYSDEVAQMLRKHLLLCFATGVEKDYFFETDSLDLSGVNLTNIPIDFGQFTQLKKLNLAYTQVSKIPSGIFDLAQLEVLDLKGNSQLKKLPQSFTSLENLQELSLEGLDLTNDEINQIRHWLPQVRVTF